MDYAQIVQDATARKRELLDEVAKLDALIASAAALAGGGKTHYATLHLQGRTAGRIAGTVVSPTRDAVRSILRDRGEPVVTRELVPLVRAKGIDVGGKDPVATLSARLSNSPEFVVHRGLGWWFKGETPPVVARNIDLDFEAADASAKEQSAASSSSKGGSDDAAALASDPDRE